MTDKQRDELESLRDALQQSIGRPVEVREAHGIHFVGVPVGDLLGCLVCENPLELDRLLRVEFLKIAPTEICVCVGLCQMHPLRLTALRKESA